MTDKFIRIRRSLNPCLPTLSSDKIIVETIVSSRDIKRMVKAPAYGVIELHSQDKEIPLTCEQYDYVAAQLVDVYPDKPIVHPVTAPVAGFDPDIYRYKYVALKTSLYKQIEEYKEMIDCMRQNIVDCESNGLTNNIGFWTAKIEAVKYLKDKLNKLWDQS